MWEVATLSSSSHQSPKNRTNSLFRHQLQRQRFPLKSISPDSWAVWTSYGSGTRFRCHLTCRYTCVCIALKLYLAKGSFPMRKEAKIDRYRRAGNQLHSTDVQIPAIPEFSLLVISYVWYRPALAQTTETSMTAQRYDNWYATSAESLQSNYRQMTIRSGNAGFRTSALSRKNAFCAAGCSARGKSKTKVAYWSSD